MDWPAEMDTLPPAPELELPMAMDMSPLTPPRAGPTARCMSPVLPFAVVPTLNRREPEGPDVPAFSERMTMLPEEALVEPPERMRTLPPLPAPPLPA